MATNKGVPLGRPLAMQSCCTYMVIEIPGGRGVDYDRQWAARLGKT